MINRLLIKYQKYIIFLSVLLVILGFFRCSYNRINHYKNLSESLRDSLKTYTDEKGRQVSERRTVQLKRAKELKSINDSLYQEVKKLKRLSGVTKLETVAKYEFIYVPVVEIDTINTEEKVFPTYTSNFNEKWFKGKVEASSEAIKLDLVSYNSFIISHQQKRGIFKRKEASIKVVNENPNTETIGLETYTFKPKERLFRLGFQAGYGITPKGLQPYLGVGIGVYL